MSVCFQDECGGPDVRAGRAWGVFPCCFFRGGGGGGGGYRCIPPGCRRVRPSSGVWPACGSFRLRSVFFVSCRFWISGCLFGEGRLWCGWPGRWPAVFPSGFGGSFAEANRRASPVGSCCQGATPEMKLVTRSWIVGQGEYTNGIESMKYVPQRTASVWMPFKQGCDEESGDADFDSFKTAPWDDGETQRNETHEVMCRPMVHKEQACDEESGDADLDSFKTAPWDAGGTQRDETHEVMCRQMVHNVDRLTTGNTKCVLTNVGGYELSPVGVDPGWRRR